MILCQVSMIAEICIHHAQVCITELRFKTTLQNSFKNQLLLPLIIRVKKASGFKSFQASKVRIGCEDQSFWELQYRDRLFVDPFGSKGRSNAFFDTRLTLSSTSLRLSNLLL